jgi:hypothetical protein
VELPLACRFARCGRGFSELDRTCKGCALCSVDEVGKEHSKTEAKLK